MPNYDFYHAFKNAPLRFQQFACAVVSRREACIFQRYGEGPDGGIDGLFVSGDARTIVQAKRTKVRGRALRTLLRQERSRLGGDPCTRYILVLSTDSIIDSEKQKIMAEMPEILSTGDIITGADLNALLESSAYSDIEREYSELWFASGNFLEDILSRSMTRDILKRSNMIMKLMEADQRIFVETEVFHAALGVLEKYHRVIISGDPGAGKTTHARCLANYYIRVLGFEAIYFVSALKEIERILGEERGQKTVIVFDDFWGHSSFNESRMEFNAEQKLQELFGALKYYPYIRLIFTTREFIFTQGLRYFPEAAQLCELEKINLNLRHYSLAQKAEILYRHLEASELEYKYVEQIFGRRERIIHCNAYSPRSVAYYLEHSQPKDMEPMEYARAFEDYVKNPKKYYASIFEELTYGAKLICFLLVTAGEELRLDVELKLGFMRLADAYVQKVEKEQFADYLRELEDFFTERRPADLYTESLEDVIVLDFVNYSIRDFMKDYLKAHIEAFEFPLAEHLIYYNQLYFLVSEMAVSEPCRKLILRRLMEERRQLKYAYVFNMDVYTYYSVDADPEEYDEHKIWQLIVLYDQIRDPELYDYLKTFCDKLIEDLNAGALTKYGMEAVVNLIPQMCKLGYTVDPMALLRAYYEHISWSIEIRDMDLLRTCGPEQFDAFLLSHKEDIRARLPRLILEDIDYLLDEENGDEEIDYLFEYVPELLRKYDLSFTANYQRKMYRAAERSLPEKVENTDISAVEIEQAEELPVDFVHRAYETITKEARRSLVPLPEYLTSTQIKQMQYAAGKNYRKGYLTKGEFTHEDFVLVMDYLEMCGGPPGKEEAFYEGLTGFLLQELPEKQKQLACMAARLLVESDNFYFTETTLRNVYEGHVQRLEGVMPGDASLDAASLIESLVGAGVLHKTGKWYCYWSRRYMYFLALADIRAMTLPRRVQYFQDELIQYVDADADGWVCFLKENAETEFYEYLVAPCFKAYVEAAEQGQTPATVNKLTGIAAREGANGLKLDFAALWVLDQMQLHCPMGSGESLGTIFYLDDALALMAVIEPEVVYDICDEFGMLVDSLDGDIDEYKEYERDKEAYSYVTIRRILDSPKGRALLGSSDCLAAAHQLLARMRAYF